MTKERDTELRYAILDELANTPQGYMQTEKALRASLRLSVCPPPDDAEVHAAMRRLEADVMTHCEVDALGVKRWCITGIGRAALYEK